MTFSDFVRVFLASLVSLPLMSLLIGFLLYTFWVFTEKDTDFTEENKNA